MTEFEIPNNLIPIYAPEMKLSLISISLFPRHSIPTPGWSELSKFAFREWNNSDYTQQKGGPEQILSGFQLCCFFFFLLTSIWKFLIEVPCEPGNIKNPTLIELSIYPGTPSTMRGLLPATGLKIIFLLIEAPAKVPPQTSMIDPAGELSIAL